VEESKLISEFVKDLDTFPFKTHLQKEVSLNCGRADLYLPDYEVVIEAKGESGNIKKAIGQAISYSTTMDAHGYILIPRDCVKRWVVDACERANVGILTTLPRSPTFRYVVDVGGIEAFKIQGYTPVTQIDQIHDPRESDVVGGVDDK